jgi:hypothetical protein
MSKRVFLLGLGLALVGLAFAVTDWALWQPGVTEANCDRIRPGMSLERVEAIFGGPPNERIDRWEGGPPEACVWYGVGGDALVDFRRKDGRVRRADWHADGPKPGLFDRFRSWLGQ